MMEEMLKEWLEESLVSKRKEKKVSDEFGNYEYLLLKTSSAENDEWRHEDPTRSSLLQKDSKITLTIISMILKWRQVHSKILLFSTYREYLPLLALTGDVAILPLRILTFKSFENLPMRQESRGDYNIVSLPSRFEEIRDQIRQNDYFLHDKLEFPHDFRYGAIFLKQSLQAAVFICVKKIYIYHPLDSAIDTMDLRELLISVMIDWKESCGLSHDQDMTPYVVVMSAEDKDLEVVFMGLGFQIPEACDSNLIDEIILFPSSFATQSPCDPPPDEIYLLMGQSNMSGRGPLFGPNGILPASCLKSRNLLRSTLQTVQQEFIPSSILDPSAAMLLGQLPFDVFSDHKEEEEEQQQQQGGQENISIRYSDSYTNRILYFDLHSTNWSPVNNVLTLHQSVDILKTVGLGPGITFASRFLDLNQDLTSIGLLPLAVGATSIIEWIPSYTPPQLPTSLHSGSVRFLHSSRNIYAPVTSFSFSSLPSSSLLFKLPSYHNLFSCSMRSLFLALYSIFSSPSHAIHSITNRSLRLKTIRDNIGVLWYQGCNDAAGPSLPPGTDLLSIPSPGQIYSDRLNVFLQALRLYIDWVCLQLESILFPSPSEEPPSPSLSLPSLPIVVVAITTTRPWLTATQEIRFVQCNLNLLPSLSSSPSSSISTVNSLGLELQTDCVHLTSRSYFRLGYLLAEVMNRMRSLRKTPSPIPVSLPTSAQSVYPSDTIQLSSSDQYLVSLYSLIRSLAEHTLETYYSTHKDIFYSSSTFLSPHSLALLPPTPAPKKSLQILQSGLKPVNFVYGEISFHAILSLLREIDRIDRFHYAPLPSPSLPPSPSLFVDLGCGSCVSLLAASLLGSFSNAIGVDLMRSKLEIGQLMLSMIQSYLQYPQLLSSRSDLEDSIQQQIREFFTQYPSIPPDAIPSLPDATRKTPQVSIREGNFLNWENLSQEEWKEIKVLYLCSTCFSELDLLKEIYLKFSYLSPGSYVILLDQQLPETMTSTSRLDKEEEEEEEIEKCTNIFQLVFSSECQTSWGVASAYIYRCTSLSPWKPLFPSCLTSFPL